jgi:hypothetical protein
MSLKIHRIYVVDEKKFSPDKQYKVGDKCIYLGKVYLCISESLSKIPSLSSDWDIVPSGTI